MNCLVYYEVIIPFSVIFRKCITYSVCYYYEVSYEVSNEKGKSFLSYISFNHFNNAVGSFPFSSEKTNRWKGDNPSFLDWHNLNFVCFIITKKIYWIKNNHVFCGIWVGGG